MILCAGSKSLRIGLRYWLAPFLHWSFITFFFRWVLKNILNNVHGTRRSVILVILITTDLTGNITIFPPEEQLKISRTPVQEPIKQEFTCLSSRRHFLWEISLTRHLTSLSAPIMNQVPHHWIIFIIIFHIKNFSISFWIKTFFYDYKNCFQTQDTRAWLENALLLIKHLSIELLAGSSFFLHFAWNPSNHSINRTFEGTIYHESCCHSYPFQSTPGSRLLYLKKKKVKRIRAVGDSCKCA